MPKKQKKESVLHDWVHELTFQMQALLLTGIRGADGLPKEHISKDIVRYLRGVVCKPAGNWSGLNDNSFMWGDYMQIVGEANENIFRYYTRLFWDSHDEVPHHFLMHLLHCAEVIGYKHPDWDISRHWLNFYFEGCNSFHMKGETEEEMDMRLNDFNATA